MEKSPSRNTSGEVIKCKAALCRKAGEPLVIEEVQVAAPKAYEVRIKIICTSLCHTDVTFWKTLPPMGVFPRILGHEAFGVVESVGEHVEEVKEGDRVVSVFMTHCEECVDCKSEKSNMCTKFPFIHGPGMPRDGTSRFTDSNGEVVHNFLRVSTFVEYTVADITQVVKICPDMAPEKACLFSCGVSTGIGAAWKVADVQKGSMVAVFGLGAVGLMVVEGARVRGASKIIGVDLNPEKFEIGKKFGMTHFINPKDYEEESISKVIQEITDGGADFCFECVGLASVMNDAFNSCRWELHIDDIITHEVDFHDINNAFDLLTQGKSLRCIIWMDK